MNTTILLLGTNMGNRRQNLSLACELIKKKAGNILKQSSIYETEPWEFSASQWFYNMAVTIETTLLPNELIIQLKEIEVTMGRKQLPKTNYESRIIDIDILAFENIVLKTSDLEIPHPRLHLRKFTLLPMSEILSEWVHPTKGKNISELLKDCPDNCKTINIGTLYNKQYCSL